MSDTSKAPTAKPRRVIPRAEEQPLLSPKEVAAILGVTPATIYESVGRGEYEVIRISPKRYAFSTAELRRRLGMDQ